MSLNSKKICNNLFYKGRLKHDFGNSLDVKTANLLCFLTNPNDIYFSFITYPTEFIYNKNILLNSIKLKVLLQKLKYQRLILNVQYTGDLDLVIFDKKYTNNAIKNLYIIENIPNIEEFLYSFIKLYLSTNFNSKFFDDKLFRLYIINKKYNKKISEYLDKNKKIKQSGHKSMEETYTLIEKYDNFKDLYNVKEKYKIKSLKYMDKYFSTKKFKDYEKLKKNEVKDYEFNLSRAIGADNPAYTPKVRKEIKQFMNNPTKNFIII